MLQNQADFVGKKRQLCNFTMLSFSSTKLGTGAAWMSFHVLLKLKIFFIIFKRGIHFAGVFVSMATETAYPGPGHCGATKACCENQSKRLRATHIFSALSFTTPSCFYVLCRSSLLQISTSPEYVRCPSNAAHLAHRCVGGQPF